MNFNLVEIYNGLLRFNKHILNELAEGLKHLPNLEGASKGDSLYINEDGNPTWGSSAFILYINLIIFLLILKLLDMTGVFILNVEKKKLNLKHEML